MTSITCPRTGKQVYGTRERAVYYAGRLELQTGRTYRVYTCPHCGWWHLTSHRWHPPAATRGGPA
jgi:hypothetical protein